MDLLVKTVHETLAFMPLWLSPSRLPVKNPATKTAEVRERSRNKTDAVGIFYCWFFSIDFIRGQNLNEKNEAPRKIDGGDRGSLWSSPPPPPPFEAILVVFDRRALIFFG